MAIVHEPDHQDRQSYRKHLGVVSTRKVGRVRTCKLGPRQLAEETAWIERYRRTWANRFDALDDVVEGLKQKELARGRRKLR